MYIVIAFGKAVLGMVEAIENILDSHIVGGVAIVPRGMINTMQQEHPHYLPSSRIRCSCGVYYRDPTSSLYI